MTMEEIESLVNDIEISENKVAKPRLSLFKPNVTVAETSDTLAKNDISDTNPDSAQYHEKLNFEKLFWPSLYQQEKRKEAMIKQNLQTRTIEKVDYSIFNEDELKNLGNRPNFTAYTKAATDFIDHFIEFQIKNKCIKIKQENKLQMLEEQDDIIKEALIDLIT